MSSETQNLANEAKNIKKEVSAYVSKDNAQKNAKDLTKLVEKIDELATKVKKTSRRCAISEQ